MKFDVVLQGPVPIYIDDVVDQYASQDWVGHIILSTWHGERGYSKGIETKISNPDVKHPGIGNRNRQIVSSREGLKEVKSGLAIKARTDQIMLDLPLMKKFYDNYQTGFEDQLFVLGMYRDFPFHPRDHFIMGSISKLRKLFDCELDPYDGPEDFTKHLRSEAWIGAQYFAKFSNEALWMFKNYKQFLVDGAPEHDAAMNVDARWKHLLFRPFPRVKLAWPKYGLANYHYHVGQQHSEYWTEEE